LLGRYRGPARSITLRSGLHHDLTSDFIWLTRPADEGGLIVASMVCKA
jgi:hypothetical protein